MAKTTRTWALVLGPSLTAVAGLLIACVGDSSSPTLTPDSGPDVDASALDGASPNDSATEDAEGDASTNADAAVRLCDVAKPFGAPVKVTSLDLTGGEGSLRLSADYLTGYYQNNQDGGIGMLNAATRATPTAPFGASTIVPGIYSTSSNGDAHPSVSGDGLSLYFDTTLATSAGGSGTQNIFRSVRMHLGDAWGAPAALANVDSAQIVEEPFIREDGRELYFSYSANGSPEAIYRSLSNDGQAFGAPTPVSELASGVNDGLATVTPDDLVIYFESQRTDGGAKGGTDVWVASRASTSDPFSNLTNVAELNTPSDDRPDFITRDRCTFYFHQSLMSDAGVTREIFVATKSP